MIPAKKAAKERTQREKMDESQKVRPETVCVCVCVGGGGV